MPYLKFVNIIFANHNESESEDDQPKKMIERILDNDTKIVTNDNLITKTFTYEEADVLVIKDKSGEYCYKGKDLAILLEYTNTKSAIINNVSKKYKKSYAELGVNSTDPSIKIDPQTIFIDESGFFQLVSRSRKKSAIDLWRKITKEILPTLFRTGTYTMPAKESDIERLHQSFYDDNKLSSFMGSPCIYFSYIGKHKVIKNGKTKEEPF